MENEQWNIGDKFTTPETGNTIFTVCEVKNISVEAYDKRSCAGITSFMKTYIQKVPELMTCNSCGLDFDPSDLANVFAHEHNNPLSIESGKYKGSKIN